MKCRGISAGCILLAFAVAALLVSEAAEDEDFSPKRVRKAGKDSSHGKSAKGKKKSPKKEKESDDEEESESVEWGVTDRETWNKMQALNVPEARFEDTKAADFAAYLSKHLQDNQLPVSVKPHEYKKLKKLVDELGESMQYTIDSFFEDETEAGEEAGNEASDIYGNMIRFVE